MNNNLKRLIDEAIASDIEGVESAEAFANLVIIECFKAAMIESRGHLNPIDLMVRMKERVGVTF
jgi:hypothetical protein